MGTYAIYEGNMERLQKKLLRISNKCRNYGCAFEYREVGEEYRDVKDEDGNTCKARFVLVEAEGIAKMNGWRYVASVEHTKAGNIIDRQDASIEVPERYYTGKPYCEHCKTKRARTASFIVMNDETGEFKRVGRNCLCDFTHGLSAEAVAHYLSFFDALANGEAPLPGISLVSYYNTREMLCYMAETIKKFGFVPATGTRPTGERSWDYYLVEHGRICDRESRNRLRAEMDAVNFDAMAEDNQKKADDALAWIKEQAENSNYMHNLKTVCALEYITGGQMRLLASLYPTMDKGMAREAERRERERKAAEAARRSDYVGEVGQRVKVDVVDCVCVTSFETMYGTMYIYKFTDETGNVYTWKTGKYMEEAKQITGTIKAHNEYRGVKQTELTRCKVA